ncbi:MAG: hypothetical protein ACKOEO_11095 [Planctomycetaceae bacterium]
MDHKRVAVLSAVALVASRIADIGSTFYFNPTLSREANPLVNWLGLGAPGLLAANVILTSFLLFLLFLYWRYQSAPTAGETSTLRDFICLQWYNRRLSRKEFFTAIFCGVPMIQNWLQAQRMLACPVSWAITLLGFHHAFSWWAVSHFQWQSYSNLRNQTIIWNYPMFEAIFGLTALMVFPIVHLRREFRQHLHSKTLPESAASLPDHMSDDASQHTT